MYKTAKIILKRLPWNKDRLIGQKRPLTLKQIWSIRMSLHNSGKVRDLTLFDLAIDSKLRACDLPKLKFSDVCSDGIVNSRATVVQQKTGTPVQFEITGRTRRSIENWLQTASLDVSDSLFPSRQQSVHPTYQCASTRELCRLGWPPSAWILPNTELTR